MILVSGAAGKTGQAVIRALVKRWATVRALVYHPEQIEVVKNLGATEVMVGNMLHLTTCKQAMLNAQAVYHICSNINPDELTIGQQMIEAAQWAKVTRFVYHSVLHPQTEGMSHHWLKLRVEEKLWESGLDVTVLQPTAYMQNLLGSWQTIVDEGIYRVPYAVETRLSLVDVADVAEVAALVLTESGHSGATYELVGADSPTQIQVATLLSEVLGRPIRAEQQSLDAWTTQAQASGLGEYAIETLQAMFRYYEAYHFVGNPNVLTWLLNRPPTSLESFLRGIQT